MLPCDPTAAQTSMTNSRVVIRSNRIKQGKEVKLYGRLHSDLCNVSLYLFPGAQLQIKF